MSTDRRTCCFALLFLASTLHAQEKRTLALTPETVAWGYYAANTPPAIRIPSGTTLEIETCSGRPETLEAQGVPASQVCPALRDIYKKVTNKGPGGHILTGPVYVEGAEPGDVLEVQIKDIRLAVPYALNSFRPGA